MSSGTRAHRVRTVGLAVVMLGALSVSVRGQVEAVWPLLGWGSIVLALTNDVAALLALNEVISTSRADVRRWAWAVLLLAGGTASGLNTWHALTARVDPAGMVPRQTALELEHMGGSPAALPPVWAVVVGAGPVLLSMVLSHLMALASIEEAAAPSSADPSRLGAVQTVTEPARVEAMPAAVLPAEATTAEPNEETLVDEPVTGTAVASTPAASPASGSTAASTSTRVVIGRVLPQEETASRGGQVAPTLLGPGTHRVLAVVPSAPREADTTSDEEPSPDAASPDDRVAALVKQLRTGAALTGAEVGEQLDCSPRTGRRLLRLAMAQMEVEDGPAQPAQGEAVADDRAADGTGSRPERSNPSMTSTTSELRASATPAAAEDAMKRDTRTG